MHWSERYIGLPYVPQVADCASLASRVSREQFGITPALPASHATTHRAQAAQIMGSKDDLADRLDVPEDGCVALFVGRGQVCHVGVMCHIAHEWWVLHADQTAGAVVLQRLRAVTAIHFKLEGFYRWKR